MPARNEAAFDFLMNRRSYPAKAMAGPAPDEAALGMILTAALRVPDHGRLEPWRILVLERAALARIADVAEARAGVLGLDAEQTGKGRGQFDRSVLALAVVCSPKPAAKVPEREQILSCGALCLGILNAAQAAGWAACWLTGWPAHDRGFLEDGLGLAAQESLAGFIHLGSETVPAAEREQPDAGRIVTWVRE